MFTFLVVVICLVVMAGSLWQLGHPVVSDPPRRSGRRWYDKID